MFSHADPTRRIALTTLLIQARSRATSDRRVMKIIETVQNNLPHDHAPEELARSVNLSLSRLRHLFKKATDLSLAQYIKLFRIERAAYLLETEFLTTKVVLAKVEIKDESHFVRDFKTVYGVTPACYRNYYPGNRHSQHRTQAGSVAWI